MNLNRVEKSKERRPSLTVVLGLLVCGTAVAIVLALGFSQLILDACGGDTSCQKPLLALFAGIAFTQALTVIACFALVDCVFRQSEARLLNALRGHEAKR